MYEHKILISNIVSLKLWYEQFAYRITITDPVSYIARIREKAKGRSQLVSVLAKSVQADWIFWNAETFTGTAVQFQTLFFST